jgi:hypothetical protein
LHPIGFGVELQHCRMLRLPPCASVIDDHVPCGSSSDVLAHVPLDKPERQIDTSRHPGGGPYRAIGNEDAVHLDPDFRKALLQLLSTGPVRRRTPTVPAIDKAWMIGKGDRIGPFEILDGIGMTTIYTTIYDHI